MHLFIRPPLNRNPRYVAHSDLVTRCRAKFELCKGGSEFAGAPGKGEVQAKVVA